MKNKKKLVWALLCACCLQLPAQKPYCIHQKNGNQSIFYTHLVDSMTVTVPPSGEGSPYLQVWTPDSVHRVAVADIDSLSFEVPPLLQVQEVQAVEPAFALVSCRFAYVPAGASCGVSYTGETGSGEVTATQSADGTYTLVLSGLTAQTRYSFAPFVRTAGQTWTGEVQTFTTPARTRGEDESLWVDLGLSVQWATQNLGAAAPEESGWYFAWGEVAPKTEYTVENCLNYDREQDICGLPAYDAATANWGDGVHLPTTAQVNELLQHCTADWTVRNGTAGYLLTSEINGKSIFLPAAGYRAHGEVFLEGQGGYYWTTAPQTENHSYSLDLTRLFLGRDWSYRSLGHTLRPVRE